MFSKRDRFSDRYRFTDDEKLLLETVLTYNPYPNRETTRELAKKLAVNEKKVVNWFSHRRFALKERSLKARNSQRKSITTYMYIYLPLEDTTEFHLIISSLRMQNDLHV